MSAQNSAGIQTLLDAEREAQKIVQKARECTLPSPPLSSYSTRYPNKRKTKDRSKRVKDARAEAQSEIEEYRRSKDEEFKKFEKEHTSGNRQAEEDASKDADRQLSAITEAGEKTGGKVIQDLLRVVTEVKVVVPERVVGPAKG